MLHASTGTGSMQRSGSTSVGSEGTYLLPNVPCMLSQPSLWPISNRRPTQCGTYAVVKCCNDDHLLSDRFVRFERTMISVVHARQAPGPLPPPPSTEYLNEDLAPRMLAIDGILFGLAMICVLLRVYVRAIMLKTLGVDGE
jgi:hypothetical protein